MNRRRFMTVTTGALVAAQFTSKVSAQDSLTEPRWDDASQLFGNAFDLLPKAADGACEIVAQARGKFDAISQLTEVYAVIHNNTDGSAVITGFATEDPSLSLTYASVQPIANPGGFVLVELGLFTEIAEDDDLPALTVQSLSPEEAESQGWYMEETLPLKISNFMVDDQNRVSFDVTNESEEDFPEASIDGLVIFFDEDGIPVTNLRIYGSEDLPAGATKNLSAMSFEHVDSSMPFLAGCYIYTDF